MKLKIHDKPGLAAALSRPAETPADAGKLGPAVRVQPLSDYELASRLSYFLWASMPDATLLARATARIV